MPEHTLPDVLQLLEEYRCRVHAGEGPDPGWDLMKHDTFETLAEHFRERGDEERAEAAREAALRSRPVP
jgi:hypothetical protein